VRIVARKWQNSTAEGLYTPSTMCQLWYCKISLLRWACQ